MTLLFFNAPWCSVCHAIKDSIPSYAKSINCEEDQETPVKYGIIQLPTFLVIDDESREVGRLQTTNVKAVDKWFKALEEKNAKQDS